MSLTRPHRALQTRSTTSRRLAGRARALALTAATMMVLATVATGCRDKRVPKDKVLFIGTWVSAQGTRLEIRQNGRCTFSGKIGRSAHTITNGRVRFKGNSLICKDGSSVRLQIDQAPRRRKGQWVVRLGGQLFGRGAAPTGFGTPSPRAARRRSPGRRASPGRPVVPKEPPKPAAPKVGAGAVTFRTVPLQVGLERVGTITSNTFYKEHGRPVHHTTREQVRLRVERVRNGSPVRSVVKWLAQQSVTRTAGTTRTVAGPLQGRTFVVELGIGKLDITDLAGHPVLGRVGRAAMREADRVLDPVRMSEALPRTPLQPGENLEGLATMVTQSVQDRWSRTPRDHVTRAEVKVVVLGPAKLAGEPVGLLRLEAAVTVTRLPAPTLRVQVTGWLAVALDGARPRRLVLGGPIQVGDRPNAGWTRFDAKYTYRVVKRN